MKKEITKYILALIGIYILCYILPLGYRDLIVPDETRYAEIAREMVAGGDWIVPHLNGLRYFEKPVLGYWAHAASIMLFGENNFAVRFPSALAVGLSALLIYLLVYKVYRKEDNKNHFSAALAVLIFLTSFEVVGLGNTAVLDGIFSFFLTASIIFFFIASEENLKTGREKRYLLLSGISCGLAFLTKGFLAFVIPVMTLAPYLVWQKRYKDLLRMSWLPLLCAVLVSLPWNIAIYLREPDFWRYFIWNEHIRRFISDSAQHSISFWFFLLISPVAILPWAFLTPAAFREIRMQINAPDTGGRLMRLSLCWLVLPFLFFSVSKGKLITYILPCFPPFAVLLSLGLSHIPEKVKGRSFKLGVVFAGILFSIILLAFIYLQFFGYHGFYPYNKFWKVLMVANSLLLFILFCGLSLKSQSVKSGILLFGIAPLLLYFSAHFIVPDLTIEKKAPGTLLERNKQDIGQKAVILSDSTTVGAVCWYLKRSDVYLINSAGELDYGIGYADSAKRLLDIESTDRLINRNRGDTVLVSKMRNIRKWKGQLPEPLYQDDNGINGYVLWRY
ncbi:MAG: phospholipid carrier-dependent glycosyltransferase [Desulfobacterium sp.]|nr:phospholipid carrier-dependent glycosyltransferase [Desulfobacterium sp.]MBU3947670.1 phospholipid carrier-dependent glycosyltransferase [Pseudomonadota bacterium]MBU4010080.1 phospholipid carrier-dependent glycosyltransferase [Pseudomonadota bacterium]MBU4037115.1 phospholipid carrier-dependent glycosyltransferase [Pseudomonadota bacterium]